METRFQVVRLSVENKQFDVLGLWGAGIGTLESATKAGIAIRWGLKDVIAKNIDTWIPSIEKTEKYCRLILEKQEKEGKLKNKI